MTDRATSGVDAPTHRNGVPVAVSVRQLVKRYKKGKTLANDGVDLEVASGELFGLLGPNGAGKTTLVQQILGLLQPTSGEIRVFGIDAVRQPERVKRLSSFMPQKQWAMHDVAVRDALAIVGQLRGQRSDAAYAQADRLLETLGLASDAKKAIRHLSGGMNRVAAFAMALMGKPRLLVLDEPTNELDPLRRRVVWDQVRALRNSGDTTCILVTHNVLEAERVIERVAIVDKGKIAALGTPGGLKVGLGDRVRLDVYLRPGCHEDPQLRAAVQALGEAREVRPGYHAVLLERQRSGEAVDRLLALGEGLDDFRLAPPTLEDVYLSITGNTIDQEGAA